MIEFSSLIKTDYFWRALLGGIGVALVAGPLGTFVVWRRMAYFGDTLAHSGLLGVTLAIILNINITLGVVGLAILLSIGLLTLRSNLMFASDTLLGILSHGTLAVGLVALSLFEHIRIDVLALLYGDILSISLKEVLIIFCGGSFVIASIAGLWSGLLRLTLHADLATAEGVPVKLLEAILTILLAIVVAIAMKIVGVLLITAMLIIPAATSRAFAKTPEGMAIGASIVGAIAVLGGLLASFYSNVPTGPAIVVFSLVLFLFSFMINWFYTSLCRAS